MSRPESEVCVSCHVLMPYLTLQHMLQLAISLIPGLFCIQEPLRQDLCLLCQDIVVTTEISHLAQPCVCLICGNLASQGSFMRSCGLQALGLLPPIQGTRLSRAFISSMYIAVADKPTSCLSLWWGTFCCKCCEHYNFLQGTPHKDHL